MVEISQETPDKTETRLLKVIARSKFKIFAESYAFEEFPLDRFSQLARQDALALIRDDEVWSQLIPCIDSNQELFKIFSFHFEDCADNSGFVGWLASHLKTELGTGVFVTCGQNLKRGGIYDYWGCPLEISDKVISEIELLIVKGTKLVSQSAIAIQTLDSLPSKPVKIENIDHFVLTVKDIKSTCEFYSKVLDMEVVTFDRDRVALKFGNQKINIHQFGKEIEPKAIAPTPGSADFCLITKTSLDRVIEHLRNCQVEIIEELVSRTGAVGEITSIYVRDPEGNLIEISSYKKEEIYKL